MERDWEQTWQGGSGGWIRHRAFGTALEHPVPRNTSDDEEGGGASAAAWPLGTASAAIGFAGASPLLETARGRGEAGDGGGANRTTGSGGRRCAEFVWSFAHRHEYVKLFPFLRLTPASAYKTI